MSTKRPPILGTCPTCRSPVRTYAVTIEYDSTDRPAVYAECPACRDVVHPESP